MSDKVLDQYILDIVQSSEIIEQSVLQQILKERGINIPQATLSRKLKKLKIAKFSGSYRVMEYTQQYLPAILNMQISDSDIIVLHTNPGQANSLAYFMDKKYVDFSPDESKRSGILGTIAGDDTVAVIIKNKESLSRVLNIIYENFPYLKTASLTGSFSSLFPRSSSRGAHSVT